MKRQEVQKILDKMLPILDEFVRRGRWGVIVLFLGLVWHYASTEGGLFDRHIRPGVFCIETRLFDLYLTMLVAMVVVFAAFMVLDIRRSRANHGKKRAPWEAVGTFGFIIACILLVVWVLIVCPCDTCTTQRRMQTVPIDPTRAAVIATAEPSVLPSTGHAEEEVPYWLAQTEEAPQRATADAYFTAVYQNIAAATQTAASGGG